MAKHPAAPAQCGNCSSVLTGPYCAQCGQHAHESARSIAALFHDAWHMATHVDDRFWVTLITLLIRPGVLTKEYFADHRARYLPPVRVYLVLSVLFFAMGGLNANKLRTLPPPASAAAAPQAAASTSTQKKTLEDDDDDEDNDVGKDFFDNFKMSDCTSSHSSFAWIDSRLKDACLRNLGTGGAAVKAAFFSNIPKMMFVFVPLVALTMLLLYWRPRRYYVEHLVFFLHNHAAMFSILLVESVIAWIVARTGHRSIAGWVSAITCCFAVWYVYRAMRVYYGQGRFKTTAKLCVVGFAYAAGLSLTLLVTLIVSVMFG